MLDMEEADHPAYDEDDDDDDEADLDPMDMSMVSCVRVFPRVRFAVSVCGSLSTVPASSRRCSHRALDVPRLASLLLASLRSPRQANPTRSRKP